MRWLSYHLLLITICIGIIHALKVEMIGGIERASQYALYDMEMAYKLVDTTGSITTILLTEEETLDQMMKNRIDFGMTLSSIPYEIAATFPTLRLVPLVTTGLAPIYSLKALGANAATLIITRPDLARIFDGKITNWRMLQSSNPLVKLPDQNITLVFEEGPNPKYTVMKRAFNKFYSPAGYQRNVSHANDWPYDRYADYISVPASTTTLVSTVIATDGALAVTCHAIAVLLNARVAKMKNKSGRDVSISPDSLSLASLELGTGAESLSSEAADLTDASNPAAWPITLFSYVVIDVNQARATCKARQLLVAYFLAFFRSTVMNTMLHERGYANVPSVVLDRLGVITFFTEQVRCRGQIAQPAVLTKDRFLGASKQSWMKARLISTVYLNVNATFKYTPQIAEDEVLVSQLMTSEIDVALLNPDYVSPDKWQEFMKSDDFLVLPLYSHAVTYFANPLLRLKPYLSLSSSSTVAITPEPIILTLELLVLIAASCIRNWNDPRILAANTWMVPIISNETIPFKYVAACSGGTSSVSTMASFLGKIAMTELLRDPAQAGGIAACFSASNPHFAQLQQSLQTCEPVPGFPVQFVQDENAAPPIAIGTAGAISMSIQDSDPVKLFPHLARTRNNVTSTVQGDVSGIMACAYDTYNSKTMWFDFARSRNSSCWPFVQATALVVRKRYWSDPIVTNASSCSRGIDALRFAAWAVTTSDLDAVADSERVGRLIDADPRARVDYLMALEAALCDDNTLLVTLPTIWELSPAFKGLGLALTILGMMWTVFHMSFVVFYRNHPSVRSASPRFVLTSLVGILLMFSSVIALLEPANAPSCGAVAWLFDVGIMLAFAPLFAKCWRIFKIFGGRKLKVVKITNRKLAFIVSVLMAYEFIMLTAWQVVSPLKPVRYSLMEGNPQRENMYTHCSTTGQGTSFFIAVALSKGAVMIIGALLAFSTRRVTSQFNESSHIAFIIYNFVFTIGIIAAIFLVIEPKGDVEIALMFLVAIWISFFTGTMLVAPKMFIIWGQQDEKGSYNAQGSTADASTGFSFLSLDMLSTLPMIGVYISALRRHLEAVEGKQMNMKRATMAPSVLSPRSTASAAASLVSAPSRHHAEMKVHPLAGQRSPPHLSVCNEGEQSRVSVRARRNQ